MDDNQEILQKIHYPPLFVSVVFSYGTGFFAGKRILFLEAPLMLIS